MSTLTSSVLVIGDLGEFSNDLGFDHFLKIEDFQQKFTKEKHFSWLDKSNYSVVVFLADKSLLEDLDTHSDFFQKIPFTIQKIFIHFNLPLDQLKSFINTLTPFKVLNSPDQTAFQQAIQEALEQHSLISQNTQLLQLMNEQNERLTKLSNELEKRVAKRESYLYNAKKKLLTSNERVEALHRALVAIHQADSVGELESLLIQALSETFQLEWIRILFHKQSFFEQQSEMNQFQFDLFSSPLIKDREHIGQVYFARPKKRPFKKDEHNFLIQVSDGIALAIDRLTHLERTETLKQQWEATFDAISAPLSLVSENYNILRCNQSFAQQTAKPITDIIGKKCYETFFHRSSPCTQCRLGQSFRLTPMKTATNDLHTFEVSSQKLDLPIAQENSYVVVYHDVSAQQKWERQLIESAKMAEIGTIGSSIAHELNNPLGGMISFLQLIKADLNGNESFYEDITEMEKGAIQCKEIVQDLLNYSRKPSNEVQSTDLKEVLQQATKLTELQTRSKGIDLQMQLPDKDFFVSGQKNLLTQAFRHLLQNANQSIAKRMTKDSQFSGRIFIFLDSEPDSHSIKITTNLAEPSRKLHLTDDSELSLTITNQIINEHSGTLEIFSDNDETYHFSVNLPRQET